ncbi:hypothetical protein AB4Z01_19205 [Inquilinus sp. YAF38]|uniref:hypothetical protein n=1 Tax=Inquilinus sp. YAF38 TaxID=3233084 RepID=UPI003F935AE3
MPITGRDWEIHIVRSREETRVGKAFARTVSSYQVFHDGAAVAQLSGTIVERQGPGDNTSTGVSKHRRVAAGTYELHTHDGAGNNKYMTIGYSTAAQITALPRPALRLSPTGSRTGILIHPANGYLWAIGCLNPGSALNGPNDNVQWSDSRSRVIAIIDDLKAFLGGQFPTSNNREIPRCQCVIDGEP